MARLRHNRRMSRTCPVWIALCLLLAGCGRGNDGAASGTVALPALEHPGGRMTWAAQGACADCTAIRTRLRLENGGAQRPYRLVEIYFADGHAARFVETGQWQRNGDLLRLQGDDGSHRVFALRADGGLQPRDSSGRTLPHLRDDVLQSIPDQPPH